MSCKHIIVMSTYTHAKDYLIELANNPNTFGWLKDLIIKVITNNGHLSDQDLDDTKEQLKANGASSLAIPAAPAASASSVVRLEQLHHHSGVCALAPDQKIVFSDQVTLLYGKNGSGKSSYFRILNEIVGGNRPTTLFPNIYGSSTPIDVDLSYTVNGEKSSIHWDGTTRAIEPLNLCSVFDTEYSSTFLLKRSADEAIVMPYGLHLFTSLTSAMDSVKDRLETEKTSIQRTLPIIDQQGLSDDVKRIITQQSYRTSQKQIIESLYDMPEEEVAKLTGIEAKIKELNETNFDDKVKLISSEKLQIQSVLEYITTCISKIESYASEMKLLFESLKEARRANEETKQKIHILSEIGNTDIPEWKDFIISGVRYSDSSTLDADICPYCRQKLADDAKKILASYSDFLADKTQVTLTELLLKKSALQERVGRVSVDYTISEDMQKILEEQIEYPALKDIILNSAEAFSAYKLTMLNMFGTERYEQIQVSPAISQASEILQQIVDNYASTIEKFKEDKAKRDLQLVSLREQAKVLVEHKAISSQKTIFQDWFSKMHSIHELESCQKQLSTRTVSTLAKNASQHLVTDNLKVKFQEELNEMGLSKLHVNLEEASASRGRTTMQIHLTNNANAKSILSEGEQKGVALALFIAERRMQLTCNPIILDDPVNSLDHQITGKFIARLVNLDNQILIFSHNILLKSTLLSLNEVHECGNNQRASCKKQSKHLYLYLVQSQGRDLKGVISEGKQEKAKVYLQEAKQKLDVIPFTELSGTASLLRHAIELMVDEVILNNQVPVKFHGKKNNIYWDQLKGLRPDAVLIDKLQSNFNRLSGGDLHAGIEQTENPIDHDELMEIYNNLYSVMN